jgi:hypothetical protein
MMFKKAAALMKPAENFEMIDGPGGFGRGLGGMFS